MKNFTYYLFILSLGFLVQSCDFVNLPDEGITPGGTDTSGGTVVRKVLIQDFLISKKIRGTIIIANEGLNGTISGNAKDIKSTINKLKKIFFVLYPYNRN